MSEACGESWELPPPDDHVPVPPLNGGLQIVQHEYSSPMVTDAPTPMPPTPPPPHILAAYVAALNAPDNLDSSIIGSDRSDWGVRSLLGYLWLTDVVFCSSIRCVSISMFVVRERERNIEYWWEKLKEKTIKTELNKN